MEICDKGVEPAHVGEVGHEIPNLHIVQSGADGQIEVGGFTWVGVAFGISIRASLLLTTYCNSNMICPLS